LNTKHNESIIDYFRNTIKHIVITQDTGKTYKGKWNLTDQTQELTTDWRKCKSFEPRNL